MEALSNNIIHVPDTLRNFVSICICLSESQRQNNIFTMSYKSEYPDIKTCKI